MGATSTRCWGSRWAHMRVSPSCMRCCACCPPAAGRCAGHIHTDASEPPLVLLRCRCRAGADPKAALLRDLCLPRLRCGAALLLPLPALSCCPAGCITIAGLLYHWFAPGGADCSLNISLITLSLVLCIVLSLITLHPQASVGWGLLGNWRRVWPAAAYRCSRGMQQPNGPQQLRRRLVFPHHRHVRALHSSSGTVARSTALHSLRPAAPLLPVRRCSAARCSPPPASPSTQCTSLTRRCR